MATNNRLCMKSRSYQDGQRRAIVDFSTPMFITKAYILFLAEDAGMKRFIVTGDNSIELRATDLPLYCKHVALTEFTRKGREGSHDSQ